MAVCQLGRKTDIVRHDRGGRPLITLHTGRGGEDNFKSALHQKGGPKRKVFIHVKTPGDAIS